MFTSGLETGRILLETGNILLGTGNIQLETDILDNWVEN